MANERVQSPREALLVECHGVELVLEAALERMRKVREAIESGAAELPQPAPALRASEVALAPAPEHEIAREAETVRPPSKRPGSPEPAPERPSAGDAPVKGRRRAKCIQCDALHWNGRNSLCDACRARVPSGPQPGAEEPKYDSAAPEPEKQLELPATAPLRGVVDVPVAAPGLSLSALLGVGK